MKKIIKNICSIISAAALVTTAIVPAFASELNGTKEILCSVGDDLTVGDYAESAEETQKLIDNRPDIQRQMENLDRGLVAVSSDSGVFVSWRWLGTESLDVKYNLYRNGEKLNDEPMSLTNYTDNNPVDGAKYSVSTVINGVEGEKCDEVSVWNDGYLEIKLNRPEQTKLANGDEGSAYCPGDASVADLDGDGQLEIVLKWDGTVRDASKAGYTSNCILDAYELDGTQLWRIDMGPNIRSGPHDTQFIVGDFDGDGSAEMAVRTADGTVAGDGTVIGDADAKWYEENNGKNLTGPLYLTVFKGTDGSIIDTTEYYPQSTGTYPDGTTWDISSWGDTWGNRSERYLGGMASFDGIHTSFIQARGYYDRSCVGAWHLENGKIVEDWTFDSKLYGSDENGKSYSGQGYHSMSVADVDYDGKDEVIYGSLAIDDDGTPMYTTGLGHGDSQHVGDLDPSRPGLEVYSCHEWTGTDYGFEMRDARTGEILYGLKTGTDNGRACAADIDPRYPGAEAWSAYGVLTAADGTVLSTNYSMPANFAIYWDGDLGREIENGNSVYKWNTEEENLDAIFKAFDCHSINAAKSNPSLQADILGDWREELIFPTDDMEHLRIFTTTDPTGYRIPTLMSDGEYRDAIGWQNVCYNQSPHMGYNLSYTTETVPVPQIYTVDENGNEVRNPDLSEYEWSIDDLYFGDTVDLVPGCATALVDGAKYRVDNTNVDVTPYINDDDRTMVPLRFISEAFGAKVSYDEDTKEITVKTDTDELTLKPGENTINSASLTTGANETITMDTAAVISNDRTMVPLRAIAEALDKTVGYYDGLIHISTIDKEITNASDIKESILDTAVPGEIDSDKYLEDFSDESKNYRIVPAAIQTSSGAVGDAVNDYNTETTYTVEPYGSITLVNDSWPGIPAVILAFGDDIQHHFQIQYSSDGEKWQIGQANRVSNGVKGEYNTYYFGTPPYTKYVKYVSQDDAGTVIAEFGNLRVE